jgi:hypothetical protein
MKPLRDTGQLQVHGMRKVRQTAPLFWPFLRNSKKNAAAHDEEDIPDISRILEISAGAY